MLAVRRNLLGAIGALVLAVIIAAASLAGVSARKGVAAERPRGAGLPQSLIVSTETGLLEGGTTGSADQFLGIPYATPPTGALRWQPPRPARPWQGVRSAMSYGGRCAQLASGNGPRIDNEDCLYLNVFAPAVIPAGRKLPVLFMIHGGGLATGAGDQHDGSLLASSGHIIVVSVNYRLGPFGFLDVPGLSAAAQDGNFGLLDLQAALGWVRRNVAAFGGDAGRVTIAGESAGGWSVCALLSSPTARGLFARAIIESGGCVSQGPAAATSAGLAFAKSAGCTDAATAAACLRAKPEADLLSASGGYRPTFTTGGADLPAPPSPAIAARVPVLIGTNHDEGRTFGAAFAARTQRQYVQYVTSTFPRSAAGILRLYPWSAFPKRYTAAYAIGAILTDSGAVGGIGGCATANLARAFGKNSSPVYFYQFDDAHAPSGTSLRGYQLGAGHATELPYLWPSFNNGYSLAAQFSAGQRRLADQMVAYWAAFVTSGAPAVAGQPAWPRFAAGQLLSLRPGGATRTISLATYRAQHRCSFWDAQPPAARRLFR